MIFSIMVAEVCVAFYESLAALHFRFIFIAESESIVM